MKRLVMLLAFLTTLCLFAGAFAISEFGNYTDYGKAVARLNDPTHKSSMEQTVASRLLMRSKKPVTDFGDFSPIAVISGPGNHYTIQFGTVSEAVACMEALKGDPNVIYIHQDGLITIAAADKAPVAKADPYKSWGAKVMGADELAASIKTSGRVTVAVIDTGVASHPFLNSRVRNGGIDLVDPSNKNGRMDTNGHGTHVAGTIVDLTQGLNVGILPVRVMDNSGTISAISNGVRCAVDAGASVINMSLGGQSFSAYGGYMTELRDAVNYAVNNGAVVVVAAGNEGQDTKMSSPSDFDNCFVVAAINSSLKSASFSNFGDSVDVAAPGVNITSCSIAGGFTDKNGTSMAAPHVAAIAAMVKLANPGYSPARVENFIKANCMDLGDEGWDKYYGWGMPCFVTVREGVEGDFTYRVNEDGALITGYTGTNASVSIPDTIAGKPVVGIDERAFDKNEAIASVVIPASVKDIDNFAFNECPNLSSVTLADGLIRIGDSAFSKCLKLSGIVLPDTLTTIGSGAFLGCPITQLELPNSIEAVGAYAFENTSLASFTVPAALKKVPKGVLYNCLYLKALTIERGVTQVEASAFRKCNSLEEITIPEGVTVINNYAFADCSGLAKIAFPRGLGQIPSKAFYNSPNVTIYGYTGSAAQTTANELKLTFVSIGYEIPMTSLKPLLSEINLIGSDQYAILSRLYTFEPKNASQSELDWVSSDESVCEIVERKYGEQTYLCVRSLYEGQCSITGKAKDGSGLEITISVVVGQSPPRVLRLDKNTLTLLEGETARLSASVTPESADQGVVWTSDKPAVAGVGEDGLVTAHKTGTAIITAASKTDETVFDICEVTIETDAPSTSDFKIHILDDKTAAIEAYTGSAADVFVPAVIGGRRIVRILSEAFHKSDITSVSIPEGVEVIENKAFAGCKKLKSVSLPDSLVMLATDAFANCDKLPKVKKLGVKLTDDSGAYFVTPIFTPSNTASAFSITASPKKSAAVLPYGYVNPATDDYFTLNIKAKGKKAVIGFKDRAPYAVNSVSIKGKAKRIVKMGGEIKLKYTVKPDTARVIATWQTSDASIATVSHDGVVKPVAPGKAIITLETDVGLSDSVTVTVKGKPVVK